MSDIERRKDEHLDIVLRDEPFHARRLSGFEDIRFAHCALPELALNDVDLGVRFLGKRMQAPILISSMTGGPARSAELNRHIAEACDELGLGFGVGSQRIALEGRSQVGFGKDLRKLAPNAPIFANFGAAQLNEWNGPDMARQAVDMIEADGLIIHLNPLQEAVQPDGDTNWSNILARIEEVCRTSDFPVICKEVGAGISGRVAEQLTNAGVSVIDVAGAGGTSWVAVEAARSTSAAQRQIAEPFIDWGIPTGQAIVDVRAHCPNIPIIASGGIRNGLDAAKAVRLGADLTGLAAGVLRSALTDTDAIISQLDQMISQLRIACFCTGSRNLLQLRNVPLVAAPTYVNQC
ncbi:MAG: type 2 isopentenyl-diphosphate Delta-isomerase [Filomicrobium sp.]